MPTTNEIGDVYNIAADAAHNINAGDNVVWTGTAWDNLAGIANLSAYVLKTALASVATTGSYNDLKDVPNNAPVEITNAEIDAILAK